MADVPDTKLPITKPVITKPNEPVSVPVSASDTEASDLHVQIAKIVKEHGGLESNIPHNHAYWHLLNRFRTLVNR